MPSKAQLETATNGLFALLYIGTSHGFHWASLARSAECGRTYSNSLTLSGVRLCSSLDEHEGSNDSLEALVHCLLLLRAKGFSYQRKTRYTTMSSDVTPANYDYHLQRNDLLQPEVLLQFQETLRSSSHIPPKAASSLHPKSLS